MKLFKKLRYILLLLIFGIVLFFIDYINKIEVIQNFQIAFYENGKNVTSDVEANGISYFNAQHLLENKSGSIIKNVGYFRYIRFKTSKHNQLLLKITTENTTDFQLVEVKNNFFTWKNQEINFAQKVKLIASYLFNSIVAYVSCLNWLVISVSILGILYLLLLVLLCFPRHGRIFQKSFSWIVAIELLLFFSIVIVALCLRFSSGLVTIVSFDFEGHLGFIANFLNVGDFYHYEFSYVYPTFVLLILGLFKNINALVYAQHIIAVLSIVILYFSVRKTFKVQRIPSFFKIVLLFIIQLILFNQNLIFYEKNLHHESTLIAFFSVFLVLLINYFGASTFRKKQFLFFSAIVFIWVGTLLHYRFSVGFYLVLVILFVHHLMYLRLNNRKILFPIVLGCTLIFCLQLPETLLANKYDKISSAFVYKQFFFANAYAIDQALDDGMVVRKDFDSRILKDGIDTVLDINKLNKGGFYILGYDFDELKYDLVDTRLLEVFVAEELNSSRKLSIGTIYIKLGSSHVLSSKIEHYYRSWVYILVRNYPTFIFEKIIDQLYGFFFSGKVNFVNPYYSAKYSNNEIKNFYIPIDKLVNEYDLKFNEGVYKLPKLPSTLHALINVLIPIITFISLIFLVFLTLKKSSSFATISLSLVVYCTISTIAILHTFDLSRYSETLYPFILFMVLFISMDFVKYLNTFKNNEREKILL